jgi:hypothetical protein
MAVNFLLKRSNTASKRPTAAQLDIGELSLNYESTTPGLFFEDSAGGVRKIGPAEVSASAPNSTPAGSSGNSTGELWFDTGTNNLKIWTGAAFAESRASVSTLTTTRTLWGQNFNGSANVTGSLTSVGDITGSAAVTLSSAAASALNLNSGTTGAVALDSGTTGAINIGTNTNAKTITVGNATGATSVVVNCGTGALNIGSNAIARTVTVGNTTGASVLNLNAGTGGVAVTTGTTGTVSITSGTTGAVTFDSGTTGAVNVGTNANAKTITLGNVTGATTINVNSGTGGILVTSPHLTMVNQGEVRFREATANGTNYIGLDAPASVAADITFALPGSDATTTTGYTLKSNGSAVLSFGTANALTSDSAVTSPLDGDLWYNSADGRLYIYYTDANTSQWVDASPTTLVDNSITTAKIQNGAVTAAKLSINGSVLPTVDNTYDLGSSSFRFANVYTGDLHLKNDRGDWTIIEEEDCLTMRNNKTGKVYDIMMKERSVQ